MKKRKYLYRLVAIIILSLYFPIVFFFNYFWKKSFEEMEKSNEIYYGNLVRTLMNSFHEKTEDFRKHVISVVIKFTSILLLSVLRTVLSLNILYSYLGIHTKYVSVSFAVVTIFAQIWLL